jgi:hypothetical protein
VEELARLFLAFLAVALLIQVVSRGPAGAADWLRAKFLGKTPKGAARAANTSPRPVTPAAPTTAV